MYLTPDEMTVIRKIAPGDIISFQRRRKATSQLDKGREFVLDRPKTCVVTSVEKDETTSMVSILYRPCHRDDSVHCGWGSINFAELHRRSPFGWDRIRIVGRE